MAKSMKRFTSLDVCNIVADLRSKILGLRVANIYDLNSKTYQLKLAKPDQKEYLLIESGVRVHLTQFQREHRSVPSVITLKLRKLLRTKRVEDVKQLGIDRVIDLTLGSGPAEHHLIIELYSSGNIILTDKDYIIHTVLRTHKYDEQNIIAPQHKYPLGMTRHLIPLTLDRLKECLTSEPPKTLVKQGVNKLVDFGPMVADHCILAANLTPKSSIQDLLANDNQVDTLYTIIKEIESLYSTSRVSTQGYIFLTPDTGIFSAFAPILYRQLLSSNPTSSEEGSSSSPEPNYNTYPSFNDAVDTFYSSIEGQTADVKRNQQEGKVKAKLSKVKFDHERRLMGLQAVQDECVRKAKLIELNLDEVDQAIGITNKELANGIDWNYLWTIIKDAKRNGDPIANMIHSLKLDTNEVVLLLHDKEGGKIVSGAPNQLRKVKEEDDDENDGEGNEEEESGMAVPAEKVAVDIGLSAYGNAQKYYEDKKKAAEKTQKTQDAAGVAMKQAEKKAHRALIDVEEKAGIASIQRIRKKLWFEKFYWFISSENFLVLAGRDAQQNEILVKKHLRRGDAYVHAELHGASSCIVKNHLIGTEHGNQEIPLLTLSQAGAMTVCRSNAWNSKVTAGAWWVHPDQVSKTAPSGEYLVTGSFMIRGKKNMLPATQLVMGFGFLFRVGEESIANHVGERKIRGANDEEEGIKELTAKKPRRHFIHELDGADEGDDGDDGDDGDGGDDGDDGDDGEKLKAKVEEQTKAVQGNQVTSSIGKQEAGGFKLPMMMDTPEDDDNDDEDDDNDDEDDDNDDEETLHEEKKVEETKEVSVPEKKGRGMSIADRRRLKKLQKKAGRGDGGLDQQQLLQQHQLQLQLQQQQQQNKPEAAPKQKGPKVVKPPRGKQRKLKLMKTKYAEQDEEERKLKMEILGSVAKAVQEPVKGKGKNNQQKNKQNNQQKNRQQQQNKQKQIQNQSAQKTPANSVVDQAPSVSENTTDGITDNSQDVAAVTTSTTDTAEGTKRKTRAEKREEKRQEDIEIRLLLEEENVKSLDPDAVGKLTAIDSLTSKPLPEDDLLYVIPVCAPYAVLSSYKYKVKLVPGKLKKGKAAKAVMPMLLGGTEGATEREKELLKAAEENEIVLQIQGNVRIASGATTRAKKFKGGKKRR